MDFGTLIGILIGILGIIITIYTFKRSEKQKRIIFTKYSQTLITDYVTKIHGLNIIYSDKPIKNLISTTIKIKSIGKDTIEMDDFIKTTPLSIKTDGQFLFIGDVNDTFTYDTKSSNQIKLNVNSDSSILKLEYDCIKHNDIITFKLLHTGNNITVDGELKKGNISQSNSIDKKSISDIITIIGLTIGILFIVACGLLISGFEFYIKQCLTLLFNTCLGIILIDFYNKNYSNK